MPFIIEVRDAPSGEQLAEFLGHVPLPVPDKGDRFEFTRHQKEGDHVAIEAFAGFVERRTFMYTPVQVPMPTGGDPTAQPDPTKMVWTLEIKAIVWLDRSSS